MFQVQRRDIENRRALPAQIGCEALRAVANKVFAGGSGGRDRNDLSAALRGESISRGADAAEIRADLFQGRLEQEFSSINDADPIRNFFDLGEIVRGEKNRAAFAGIILDQDVEDSLDELGEKS